MEEKKLIVVYVCSECGSVVIENAAAGRDSHFEPKCPVCSVNKKPGYKYVPMEMLCHGDSLEETYEYEKDLERVSQLIRGMGGVV